MCRSIGKCATSTVACSLQRNETGFGEPADVCEVSLRTGVASGMFGNADRQQSRCNDRERSQASCASAIIVYQHDAHVAVAHVASLRRYDGRTSVHGLRRREAASLDRIAVLLLRSASTIRIWQSVDKLHSRRFVTAAHSALPGTTSNGCRLPVRPLRSKRQIV